MWLESMDQIAAQSPLGLEGDPDSLLLYTPRTLRRARARLLRI